MPEGRRPPASSKPATPTTSFDPSSVLATNRQAIEYWVRGMTALSEEVSHFIQARLQEDMGTWTKLTSCKDVNQALECQRQYAGKMVSDYMEEANKLSRLTMTLANEGLCAFQSTAGSETSTREAA